MKKILCFLVLIIGMIGLLAACSDGDIEADGNVEAAEGKGEHVIRLSHLVQLDNAAHLASEYFKEEVERESDGKIKVDIFPNGELYGSDRETVEAIQLDNIEMTLAGTTTIGNFDDNFYVLDLPFIFKDRNVAREALNGELGEKLTANLGELNLKSLGFGYDGIRHISNNKHPIEKLDDLKGLKVRVQESQIQQDIFKALGTNPSPLAYGEVYTALQQNTFDGMDSPASIYDSTKFYEVQKYLTLTGHSYSGVITVIGNNFYKSLPEELQEVVEVAGKNMEEEYYKLQDEKETSALKKFIDDELMEVNELDQENYNKFVDAVQPIYEKFADKFDDGLIDLARSYND